MLLGLSRFSTSVRHTGRSTCSRAQTIPGGPLRLQMTGGIPGSPPFTGCEAYGEVHSIPGGPPKTFHSLSKRLPGTAIGEVRSGPPGMTMRAVDLRV